MGADLLRGGAMVRKAPRFSCVRRAWSPAAQLGWGVSAALLATSLAALADSSAPRLTDGLALPSQNPVSLESEVSTLVNPANLAFMTGPEARIALVRTGDGSTSSLRGFSAGAAVPFWRLATGIHVDWMTPPGAAPAPLSLAREGQRYDWVRWGNAFKLADWAAFGTTLAWSNSSTLETHKLFAVSSGLTLRPWNFAGASLVLRDWNSPLSAAGTAVAPSLDMGLAVRPIAGRRMLEIGGTASYFSDTKRWSAGATLAVQVPHVGMLRAGAQFVALERPAVVANAGLEVNFDELQAAGGVVFGNAITRAGTGAYAAAAWRGFTETARLPKLGRVVKLRFDATPGVRSHVRWMRRLWQLAEDSSIEGVLLVPRADPAPSIAHAEEWIDAIEYLRQRGKKVLCHLEDATARELYVCSQADRIAMNPAGGLRFAGLASSSYFLGGLLEKLGIRADFVRIGKYKSAPEQFTEGPTAVGQDGARELLREYDQLLMSTIARGRHLSVAEARARIGAGPLIASEALAAKLVDVLAYEDEIDRFVEETFGRRMKLVEPESLEEAPNHWLQPGRVAVVYLHGDMVDGESSDVPLVGIKLAGSNTVARALKRAREDASVKAVLFRIETGGGSSLAADVILREAALTAKAKPLIVSMGSKAASGGYYAAVAGREIFANRATLTGSIGIFYGKVDFVGLLTKLGVSMAMNRVEPRADAESLFRPFTDDEHVVLGRKVKQFYDLFVGRVAEGRHLTPEAVHAVAQGHVWTGEQAATRGLVDRIGGLRQALARARYLGGLPEDAPLLELPEIKKTVFDRALDMVGLPKLQAAELSWLPPPVVEAARALVPLTFLGTEKPMARLEWLFTDP